MIEKLKLLNVDDEKVLISTFIGDNRDQEVFEFHQKVFNKYNIPINYIYAPFSQGISYGSLIDKYVEISKSITDYFIFFDVDAIPLSENFIEVIYDKIRDKDTIWGISQQSNHIKKNGRIQHPYAGFSTCGFSKALYAKIGEPSFRETHRGDIGEELTWCCEEKGYNICLSYPTEFHELTEEEIKGSGNSKYWTVNNEIKYGLGTTFGGMFYHSFMQNVPRSKSIFIEKCIDTLNPARPKIEAVIVCVDCDDFLEITLPLNKKFFDNILVITSPNDTNTQKVCKENGINCIITNKFYENGDVFNKGRAITEAFNSLKYKEWVVHLDADIIIPDKFLDLNLNKLDKNVLYGGQRTFVWTYSDLLKLQSGEKKTSDFKTIPGEGCGFFQLFNFQSRAIKQSNSNDIYPSFPNAGESDILFLKKFHPDVVSVGKLDMNCIHLGPHGTFHNGRFNGKEKFEEAKGKRFKDIPDLSEKF